MPISISQSNSRWKHHSPSGPLCLKGSIDLSNAYFHIPIHPISRSTISLATSLKFISSPLPLGLGMLPQTFTMMVKEVKLMAFSRGIRVHQYLDVWLIRAQSQEKTQLNTEIVVDLTQAVGSSTRSPNSYPLRCFQS